VSGVVVTVILSPAANAASPAAIVKFSWPEVNGVPTVAVPNAPVTDPVTVNCVALVAVIVNTCGTLPASTPNPETVPFPVFPAV